MTGRNDRLPDAVFTQSDVERLTAQARNMRAQVLRKLVRNAVRRIWDQPRDLWARATASAKRGAKPA